MNLKIYQAITVNDKPSNQQVLFNTGFITNIKANGVHTDFIFKYGNINKRYTVDSGYDDVVSDTENYDFGTKIQIYVVGIGHKDVNDILRINVDLILYAWTNMGHTEIYVADRATPRVYKTYESLAELEAKAQTVGSGGIVGEKYIMAADQTEITTELSLNENNKIYKNGVLQGFIKDLSEWTISDSNTLLYSGVFWGGEEIHILI